MAGFERPPTQTTALPRGWEWPWVALCALGLIAGEVRAGAVVVSNRTRQRVSLDVVGDDGAETVQIEAGDLVTLWSDDDPVFVEFSSGNVRKRYELELNAAFFFHGPTAAGRIDLEKIGLYVAPAPEDGGQPIADDETAEDRSSPNAGEPDLLMVSVQLLVDEEERAARPLWEARLRKRLKAASEVFQRHARVRFEAVSVATWKSNDDLKEFDDSLREFESSVQPSPAKLAIGFTSQYELPTGRANLGGTHGPLRSHILLREWSQHVAEPERLELLVHELGHYLGAVHSPEPDSVMRPILGDRQALARAFRIHLDPLNALAVCLVSEELRCRPIQRLTELRPSFRRRLFEIYSTLAQILPDDPAAAQYLALLDARAAPAADVDPHVEPFVVRPAPRTRPRDIPPAETDPAVGPRPLEEATREVLRAIVSAAEANHRLPPGKQAGNEDLFRRTGDRLTERYVRAAAEAAANQPAALRQQAFFLALAVGLDTSELLRDLPVLGNFVRRVEPNEQRQYRLQVLDEPTMRGQHDLAQHFWVAAAITANAGRRAGESAGLAKELRDAEGGSGFSFSDWCADLAGIALAEQVVSGRLSLSRLASGFRIHDFLPPLTDWNDELPLDRFSQQFGSTSDERFLQVDSEIRERIRSLPAYRSSP